VRGVVIVGVALAVIILLVLGGFAVFFVRRSGGESAVAPGEPAAPKVTPTPKSAPAPTPTPAATDTAPSIDETIAELETEFAEPVVLEPEVHEKPRLRDRLGRTRAAFSGVFTGLRGSKIDDATWDDLEEAMLLADVGLATTQRILDAVRARAKADDVVDAEGLVELVRGEVVAILDASTSRDLRLVAGEPNVWMFVGVNGVGKTTTIGKLAAQQVDEGRKVVLCAADTFRAAAADQLGLWAERTGGELVRGQDGADPGSVVFDAMAAASSRKSDLVLVDTAGRLHTKSNLMEELKKLRRIVDRTEGACKEVLLVIDASTGQNGLVQAKQFADAVDVTGIVLTKLDGTAKGGIVLAIQSELALPVKAVGVGEQVEDLVEFDPEEFAAALFDASPDR
jgi:fused signal recognition particle receptor